MRLFIDSANLEHIYRYMAEGLCDGVTTNPTIVAREGCKWPDAALDIAELIDDRPLSLEVTTDEVAEMYAEALDLVKLAPNIAVKIPVTNSRGESCLSVMHALSVEGVPVNATCCMTFLQLVLCAKAGARYVSLFGGRVDDEGGDASQVIGEWRAMFPSRLDYKTTACGPGKMEFTLSPGCELIAASIRTIRNVADWTRAGADIVTVTPAILDKLLINARTKETVAQFVADGRRL